MDVLIVGAGIFGVTAALELVRRGHQATLLDPGPVPRPEASSTDVSKAIRLDYGADGFFTDLAEACLPVWREWNERFGETVYHEDGFLFLTEEPMCPGSFESESFGLLTARGYELERLDAAAIRDRYPAFAPGRFVDGYFNPHDGWASSGRVVELLLAEARREGVTVLEQQRFSRLITNGNGIETMAGARLEADVVVVAAGAWTPALVPELRDRVSCVGQPVLHFAVDDPSRWRAPRFTTWAGDITKTGWYGFPAAADGTVKVANHGPGRAVDPDAEDLAVVLPAEEARCRAFLQRTIPALADAPIARRRLCLYCDSIDGAFWIDRLPERAGVVVATGGSGHGFKFAPQLGGLIADVVEGRDHPFGRRFRWRGTAGARAEAARRL